MDFSSLTPDEIFEKLNTSHKGLSEKEAKLYLKKYGANELPAKKKGGSFYSSTPQNQKTDYSHNGGAHSRGLGAGH